MRSFELLRSAIARHQIECDFQAEGGLHLIDSDEAAVLAEQQWIAQVLADAELCKFDPKWWTERELRSVYPHLAAGAHGGASLERHVASLHPIKLLDGLWRAVAQSRAADRISLHCNVTVRCVAPRDPASGLLRVETSRGVVLASNVVYATNAYTSALLAPLSAVFRPVRGQVIATEPRTDVAPHNVWFDEPDCFYMIKRSGDGGLVFGGARERERELDDSAIEEDVGATLRAKLSAKLGGDVVVTHEWTGCMSYTPDEHALVGELPPQPRRARAPPAASAPPERTGSGEFVMAGWCGNGMASIFAVARVLVDAIASDDWSGIPAEMNCARFVEVHPC
jgi:gamma-glutamylputrescine oxidase